MKQKYRQKSVKQTVLILILGVVLLQAGVFLFLFLQLDVSSKLKLTDISVFKESLVSKTAAVQDTFSTKWANTQYMDDVAIISEQIYRSYVQNNTPLEVSEDLGSALIHMTNNIGVAGGYIVFDSEPGSFEPKESLAIWDYNTKLTTLTNNDILVGVGRTGLARSMKLALNSYWLPKLHFDNPEIHLFYSKILQAYAQNPKADMRSLGYWSNIYRFFDVTPKIVTFTMPLLDTERKAYYGFFGIDIDVEQISQLLGDIVREEQYSYAIVKFDAICDNYVNFDVIAFSGIHYTDVVQKGKLALEFSPDSSIAKSRHLVDTATLTSHNEIFKVDGMLNKNLVAGIEEVKLYGDNSPYSDQKWYVLKIIDSENLYKNSKKILTAVFFSALVALILGVIIAIVISERLARVLKKILQGIRLLKSDPQKTIAAVGVSEIDEITQSITVLSRDVEYSASRMQQIINSIDLAIGAIEIDTDADSVYISGKAGQLLGFNLKTSERTILTVEEFGFEYARFCEKAQIYQNDDYTLVEPQEGVVTRVYQIQKKQQLSYVTISSKKMNGRILKVIIDATDNIKKIKQIQYEKDHDPLTGIYNRLAFKDKVSKVIDKRDLKKGVMVMWDLDNLKYVNDTYGHDLGDKYITKTAEIIKSIPLNNCIAARISGDEFFAFIYDFDSRQEILQELEKTQEKFVNTHFTLPGENKMKIRATAGVSWYPEDSAMFDELMKYADFAMLSGKNTQKGSINEFNLQKYNDDYILLSGKEDLNEFIENKLLSFAFQPIVDAKTGEIFAFESLMRPTSEKIKSVYDVMRLAKAQSKLYLIEKLTWFGVLAAFKKNEDKIGTRKIFINSIPNNFISKNDQMELTSTYASCLQNLVVEIIESEKIDEECMADKYSFMKQWQLPLALDDFGAGYSTESTILSIQPQFIKIDMSIIRDIDTDKNRQELVSNILGYATSRNIKIIAEGVETESEMGFLVKMGVHYLQGYLLGRPNFEIQDINPEAKAVLLQMAGKEF